MKIKKNILEVDSRNCWIVDKINDRNRFLKRIIELVPDGSIWTMQDVMDKSLLDFFKGFMVSDLQVEQKGTRAVSVLIDSETRIQLLEKLNDLSFDWCIIEHHIHNGDNSYFTSYDDLSPHATWFSKDFNQQDFEALISNGDISLVDSLEWPNKIIKPKKKGTSIFKIATTIGWIFFGILSLIVISHIMVIFIPSFQDTSPLFPDSLIKMRLIENIIETCFFVFLSLGLFIGLRRVKSVFYLMIINLIIILSLIYRMTIVGFLYELFIQ